MFPQDELPDRLRLKSATWRALHESYRNRLSPVRTDRPASGCPLRPGADWQTVDVGPWAKGTLAVAFACSFALRMVFPLAFVLAFPFGSLLALLLGIGHVQRQLEEEPVWMTPARGSASSDASPYDEWVREGRATHRAVEAALGSLPRGMRRIFWPLTQQSEDLVLSLGRLAMRARQIDDYLNSDSAEALRERVSQLRSLFESAHDPVVREHLRQADLSLQSALRDQQEMRVLRERVTAQATHVNATLHQVLSQLVKQTLTSPDGAWRDYQAAAERLKALRYQIDAVEQVTSSETFG